MNRQLTTLMALVAAGSLMLIGCNNSSKPRQEEAVTEKADTVVKRKRVVNPNQNPDKPKDPAAVQAALEAYRIELDTTWKDPAFDPYELGEEPVFDMVTTAGTIRFRFFKETPLHREVYTRLIAGHFFDGILFHRVVDGFMIQGGDPFTKDPCRPMEQYGVGDLGFWIPNECTPKITHKRGYIGGARQGDDVNPKKASSSTQFYIVQSEEGCRHLDGGYTLFAETLSGFEVIDAIASAPTGLLRAELPDSPVRILHIDLVDDGK